MPIVWWTFTASSVLQNPLDTGQTICGFLCPKVGVRGGEERGSRELAYPWWDSWCAAFGAPLWQNSGPWSETSTCLACLPHGRPVAILPAGRPGEVVNVERLTMKEAREIVRIANAIHHRLVREKLAGLEKHVASMVE